MSNAFNIYFTSIAVKTKSNIKLLHKHSTDSLSNTNTNTFFLYPTDKNEISFVISSLDSHKLSGPTRMPLKFLKLLKMTSYNNQVIILICLSPLCNFPQKTI